MKCFLNTCIFFCFWLTFIAEEVCPGAPGPVVADKGCIGTVGGVDAVRETADALLSQQPHEKLQANEGKHTEAEDSQDHHVCQLLHGLDQSADDGLQTLTKGRRQYISFLLTYRQISFLGKADSDMIGNKRRGTETWCKV